MGQHKHAWQISSCHLNSAAACGYRSDRAVARPCPALNRRWRGLDFQQQIYKQSSPLTRRGRCSVGGSWLPGTDAPSHLEGLSGNYGFDPLSLGTDKERLEWCAAAAPSPSPPQIQ